MAGGTQTTTSTQNNQPWGPTKGLFKSLYKDVANDWTGKGKDKSGLVQPDTTSMVTPFSNQTTQGMSGLMDLSNANSNGNGMSKSLNEILGNGGFNQGQLDSMSGTRDLANNGMLNKLIDGNGLTDGQNAALGKATGSVDRSNAMFDQIIGNGGYSADQQLAGAKYRNDAFSQFDLNSNPAFQQVQKNMLDAAGEGINAQAAANGRYGSGANQQILAREQGKIGSNMAFDEYRNWQNRGDQATNNLATLGQTGIQNQQNLANAQLSGLQGVSSMEQLGVGNNQNAIGAKANLENTLFNMNQAGLGNLSSAYNLAQEPSRTAMGVGAMEEDLNTRVINDQARVRDAVNNDKMNEYKSLLALLSGAGQYGSTYGTATSPAPSPWMTGIAGGLGGLSILGQLGLTG